MSADLDRDGEWVVSALRRVIENGGGSESVGCRIDALVGGDIKINRDFAALLLAVIDQWEERWDDATMEAKERDTLD